MGRGEMAGSGCGAGVVEGGMPQSHCAKKLCLKEQLTSRSFKQCLGDPRISYDYLRTSFTKKLISRHVDGF